MRGYIEPAGSTSPLDLFERRADAVVSSTIQNVRDAQHTERGRYVLSLGGSQLLGTFKANRNRLKRHRAVTTPVSSIFILPLMNIGSKSMGPSFGWFLFFRKDSEMDAFYIKNDTERAGAPPPHLER